MLNCMYYIYLYFKHKIFIKNALKPQNVEKKKYKIC